MISEKIINRIGWMASLMAMAMYVSYIDQIALNLQGHHGSFILPIVTTVNCATWTLYGWLKPQKDWPIISCNVVGIVLGIITAATAM